MQYSPTEHSNLSFRGQLRSAKVNKSLERISIDFSICICISIEEEEGKKAAKSKR